MLRAALALALAFGFVSVPATADATGCSIGPFATTYDVPLGCPVVYYESSGYADPPTLIAHRGPVERFDVTGAITQEEVPVDVEMNELDCNGSIVNQYYSAHTYQRFEIAVDGAQVGDRLTLGLYGPGFGVVVESGECIEGPIETQVCNMPPMEECIYDYEDEDDADRGNGHDDGLAGCHAGGGSAGAALVLAVLAPLARRRRARGTLTRRRAGDRRAGAGRARS